MTVIPFVRPTTVVPELKPDDPQWDAFRWHLAAVLDDDEVLPLSDEQALAVVEILCQPHVEAIEHALAASIVERDAVRPDKLAELPVVVHRIVKEFTAEFVADYRAPRVIPFPGPGRSSPDSFRNS